VPQDRHVALQALVAVRRLDHHVGVIGEHLRQERHLRAMRGKATNLPGHERRWRRSGCELGRSYPETGGTNESVVHWDLICDLRDGGRLSADGETLLADGTFS
jgi:hypothetical protein